MTTTKHSTTLNKALFFTFLFLSFLLNTQAQQFADKNYYLIDSLHMSELSAYDSLNIENGLKKYHQANDDTLKLAAIESIIDNSFDTPTAFKYLIVLRNKSTEYLKKQGKSEKEKVSIKYFLGASYYTYAFIQKDLGQISLARNNYLKALDVFKQDNVLWAIATTYNSLGFISENMEESIEYYKKALEIFEETEDIEGVSNILINLSDKSSELHQEEITFKYLHRAIKLAETLDNKRMLAVALSNLAYNNDRFNVNIEDNYQLFQRSIAYSLAIPDYRNASISLVKLARNQYSINKNIAEADSIIKIAISYSQKANDFRGEANAKYRLGVFYLQEGKTRKAKAHLQKAYINFQKAEDNNGANIVNEYLHKIYAKDKEYKNAYDALLEMYEYDQANINNKNKLLIAEQTIESEYAQQKEIDDLKNQQQLDLASEKQQRTRLGMISAAIIAGLIALFSIFIFNRLKLIRKQKIELDSAYAQLEESKKNELAVSNLKALQSQMNPHFIFNALNSVQDLVLLKDIRNSNKYLGKFSDLIRKILLSSKQQFISLEEEVEILSLYLDLEKLRFGDDFIIDLQCNVSEKQQNEIQLPAMFIQPYIENAIKHGLFHKEGTKKLMVHFNIQGNALECIIKDNGIGQEKAAEYKQKRLHLHTGFSTEAINERIRLLNETSDKKIVLKIEDLFDGVQAIGTKIILLFPV